MADEQHPPKRDVNEIFTLDASGSTSDPDGPLAHLLSASPVADLGRSSSGPAEDEASASGSDDALPGLSDVEGLEDLYVTTTELTPGEPASEPPPPTYPPASVEPESVVYRPPQPVPVNLDPTISGDPRRSFEVGGPLRFSTETGVLSGGGSTDDGHDRPYPATLVPNAVPAPVAPSKSVRVPGEERRRGGLLIVLIEFAERRWFWALAAGFCGVVVLGLLAVGNVLPNPLATSPAGVIADNPVPAAPAADASTETSETDTSSSTGAGTDRLEPVDPTTSVESTTSSTATTARRRVVTTARPTVRSTTGPPSSATTASSTPTSATSATTVSSASTVSSSSTSTSTSEQSTTVVSSSSTTDTTGSSSSSTSEQSTTSSTSSDSTTTPSSDPPDDSTTTTEVSTTTSE